MLFFGLLDGLRGRRDGFHGDFHEGSFFHQGFERLTDRVGRVFQRELDGLTLVAARPVQDRAVVRDLQVDRDVSRQIVGRVELLEFLPGRADLFLRLAGGPHFLDHEHTGGARHEVLQVRVLGVVHAVEPHVARAVTLDHDVGALGTACPGPHRVAVRTDHGDTDAVRQLDELSLVRHELLRAVDVEFLGPVAERHHAALHHFQVGRVRPAPVAVDDLDGEAQIQLALEGRPGLLECEHDVLDEADPEHQGFLGVVAVVLDDLEEVAETQPFLLGLGVRLADLVEEPLQGRLILDTEPFRHEVRGARVRQTTRLTVLVGDQGLAAAARRPDAHEVGVRTTAVRLQVRLLVFREDDLRQLGPPEEATVAVDEQERDRDELIQVCELVGDDHLQLTQLLGLRHRLDGRHRFRGEGLRPGGVDTPADGLQHAEQSRRLVDAHEPRHRVRVRPPVLRHDRAVGPDRDDVLAAGLAGVLLLEERHSLEVLHEPGRHPVLHHEDDGRQDAETRAFECPDSAEFRHLLLLFGCHRTRILLAATRRRWPISRPQEEHSPCFRSRFGGFWKDSI